MEDAHSYVDRVAAAAGLRTDAVNRYDWDAIEASLSGLRLPDDYKLFVEQTPEGMFHNMEIVRPGYAGHSDKEYLGYYAYRLDDLRDNGEVQGLEYPYPIYPQPGGVLPWAERRGGDLYCWLTEGSDPRSWPVVAISSSLEDWQTFPGPMCAHLLRILADEELSKPPTARRITAPSSTASTNPGLPFDPTPRPPRDRSIELLEAIPASDARPIGWKTVEKKLGTRLPADYKRFIEAAGPGTWCDIAVHAPDQGDEFDLLALSVRTADEAVRANLPRELFSPAGVPYGVLPWGTTAEGWTIGWAIKPKAPDEWGTGLIAPDHMMSATYPDHSFSEFLLRFGPRRDDQPYNFAAQPWTGSREFRPHRLR